MTVGYSEGFHDAALCIIENGLIVHADHAERWSRKKHDKKLYLKPYKLDPKDKVGFYERPLLKKTRQFFAGQFKTALKPRKLPIKPDKCFPHHLCHAAAAFQTSNFEEAACVVVDSIGEWDTSSIWKAQMVNGKAKYKKIWSYRYPKSIGLWYTALTKWAGWKPLDEEYIFMGQAAFGRTDNYTREILEDLFYSNCHKGVNKRFEKYLRDKKPENVAKSAQILLEDALIEIFKHAKQYSDNICYGGGVALNCVANTKLQRMCNLWIMPNPGDAGGSLGAAALITREKIKFTPYTGYYINRPCFPNDVVDVLLSDGRCGIANGKAEFGPRALGNRSLLGDPRTMRMKRHMNKIKKRHKFRPFAPAILEEHAQDYFDMPKESRYMSYVYKCKKPKEIPAALHVDNTARVQTVPKNSPSVLRPILERWYEKTGCPVLLNTSLNIWGEPMVHTWQQAEHFAKFHRVTVL